MIPDYDALDDTPYRQQIRHPAPRPNNGPRRKIKTQFQFHPISSRPPVPEYLTHAGARADDHAAYRSAQRYGLNLSLPQLRGLGNWIRAGYGEEVERFEGPRSLYCVDYYGQRCWLIWDRADGMVITFLPPR